MSNFDAYFSGDAVIKQRAYKEFRMEKVDIDNLKAIETALASKTITADNCEDSLSYLEGLFQRISQVKRNEYEYEGDNNLNVNAYLERIHLLIMKIKQL